MTHIYLDSAVLARLGFVINALPPGLQRLILVALRLCSVDQS
jgi:hypothetical protein